jgi:hypothetical protein
VAQRSIGFAMSSSVAATINAFETQFVTRRTSAPSNGLLHESP